MTVSIEESLRRLRDYIGANNRGKLAESSIDEDEPFRIELIGPYHPPCIELDLEYTGPVEETGPTTKHTITIELEVL